MYIAINGQSMTILGVSKDPNALAELAYIEIPPDIQVQIAPIDSGRTYSVFSIDQLSQLYLNMTGKVLGPRGYSEAIQAVKEAASGLEENAPAWESLAARPPKWDPSKYPDAKPRPETKPQPAYTARSPEKKERGNPSPVTRPKAGTSTGMVWDIADQLYATFTGDWKLFRSNLINTCASMGINPATVQVQYSKWKRSKEEATNV